jgi:hypothetical protein
MHKRSVETMAGALELERPYFYCTRCSLGIYPLDEALGLSPAIKQDDVQSVGVFLAAEVSYEVASETHQRCTGQEISEHSLHESVNRVAEGLGILDVCPSKEEVEEKIARIGEGKRWRPVMMMTLDGAQEPVRPEPSARKGKRANGDWKEVKGFRLYLIDEDRIEHVISWHQMGMRPRSVLRFSPRVSAAPRLTQRARLGRSPQKRGHRAITGFQYVPRVWPHRGLGLSVSSPVLHDCRNNSAAS